MEPDVIRMYSSSPPPMEDGVEDEDDEFGDFGTFSGVPNSISFTELDTPTTFNQTQALTATSPPEHINSRGVRGFSHSSSNGTQLSKANGHVSSGVPERTDVKKVLSSSLDFSVSDTSASEPADCNGGGTEVLTNGFLTCEVQGSPSSQTSAHSRMTGMSTEDDFADFASFSNAEGHLCQNLHKDLDCPTKGSSLAGVSCHGEQGTTSGDDVRDTNRTGPKAPGSETVCVHAEAPGGSCNTDRGSSTDSQQRDLISAFEAVCTNEALALNAAGVADRDESREAADDTGDKLSSNPAGDGDQLDEKGSETETETSLGRPLSTDALEEYGDLSTTGSVPSPSLHGETATPADHSQLVEDDDEDFGHFGDPAAFSSQGFADFEQLQVKLENRLQSSACAQEDTNTEEDDFGDFNSPKSHGSGSQCEDGGRFPDVPLSASFGKFSSAGEDADKDAGWSAFGEQQHVEEEPWATFSVEQSIAHPEDSEEEEWHESEGPAVGEESIRPVRQLAAPSSRLEHLFLTTFPTPAAALVEDRVASLHTLLETPRAERDEGLTSSRSASDGVWTRLQDIHEALGLQYQWGGSHCNKALLCCLGIDTRNILFTGQKKQPVIVPMYAAGLGMLEPTKEPVKPVSAAEMIASIAQASPVAPEKSSCPTEGVQQEALPPVQFDWSSSGLTNPLDASGGSSLLNLDFFGPVEDSGSTSSPSIPGVDPELYELTTAKLDPGGSGSRMADAFARLMSTMEKTSTSTRKPKKDENLSEEAAKVIAALPDLSFMQAKVLMFPTTLTPLGSQAATD